MQDHPDSASGLLSYLEALAALEDKEIDLARAALALSVRDHPELLPERYLHHLSKLVAGTGECHRMLLAGGRQDCASVRLEALREIFVGRHEYRGDSEHYDDLQNADLARVIDRRKGMPIALSILCIHVGDGLGWEICGLNVPGHYVARIGMNGQRLIFDPFDGCAVLEAPDLRALVKRALGPDAELSAACTQPAGRRETLIRLQNNIKLRRIEAEDYEGALKTVETMRLIDPQEFRLLLDAGVLYARTNQPLAAIGALEEYIARAPDARDRRDAELLLLNIREALH